MTKQLPSSDFRAIRRVLDPEDFALGSADPDPPPSDLISKRTWHGIVDVPDDVAIRTSDHNGRFIGEVYWLWGRWIEAVGEAHDKMFSPMLDASDDLQASIFDSLHGYYRGGFSALRNVIELMTIGACGVITKTPKYDEWRKGSAEFKFGAACDLLSTEYSLSKFNERMRNTRHPSLWDAKKPGLPAGYGRRLYGEMCNFAHSRPGFTDGDLRSSNGPIYVAKAFRDWYFAYLRTVSLCSILMLLSRPTGDRSAYGDLFIDDPNVIPRELLRSKKIVDPN